MVGFELFVWQAKFKIKVDRRTKVKSAKMRTRFKGNLLTAGIGLIITSLFLKTQSSKGPGNPAF
jgi:hypothetical protein